MLCEKIAAYIHTTQNNSRIVYGFESIQLVMANTRLSSADENPQVIDFIFILMERRNKNQFVTI